MNRQKPREANGFLRLVDRGEREVARILTLITTVVITAALIQLVISLGWKLWTGVVQSQATWLGDDLIKVLGDLLTVLIALRSLWTARSSSQGNPPGLSQLRPITGKVG